MNYSNNFSKQGFNNVFFHCLQPDNYGTTYKETENNVIKKGNNLIHNTSKPNYTVSPEIQIME